jgi:hypothetical protein
MVKPTNASKSAGASNGGTMPVSEMAAILGRILQRHGVAVLEDRRRTLGLLRDHAPNETRAVRLLMSAYDMDVPKHLAAESGAPAQFKIEQEVNSLIADSGLQADLARWAVNVWSAALAGAAPGGAEPAAAVAPAAAAAPSADSLTWGDEAPGVQVAPTAAPPTAPAVAPSYAPPPPSAFPAGAAGVAAMAQKPMFRYALIGAAVIIAVVGLKSYMDSSGDGGSSPTPAQPETPAQPAAAPVLVASTSEDANQWPAFPGAAHPDNNPNSWQFQFNLRFADARVMAYNVFVAMNANGRAGSGSVRALDIRYLSGGADKVSSTPSLPVSRELEPSSKVYITRINTTSWANNPSQAPSICVIFSSGDSPRSFDPDKGVFCAFELQGNTCGSQKIGCGRLQ